MKQVYEIIGKVVLSIAIAFILGVILNWIGVPEKYIGSIIGGISVSMLYQFEVLKPIK